LERDVILKEVGRDPERKLGTSSIAAAWSRGFWIWFALLLAGIVRYRRII